MSNLDPADLLTKDEVLALPYYRGRQRGKSVASTTLFRHVHVGRLTPGGERIYLRQVKLASGTFFRRSDIDRFFQLLNGWDDGDAGVATGVAGAGPQTPRSPLSATTREQQVADAEAEFAAV